MLDKLEPPVVPDGYGISVAYACLMEIIRSLQIMVNPQQQPDAEAAPPSKENSKELNCQLINSSWCGLLAALSPLVDASTDESITENVLKALQTYTALCGLLDLHTPRDAFITAICKSSLPPHYALTVLNTVSSGVSLRQGKKFIDFNVIIFQLSIWSIFIVLLLFYFTFFLWNNNYQDVGKSDLIILYTLNKPFSQNVTLLIVIFCRASR